MPTTIDSAGITFNDTTSLTSASDFGNQNLTTTGTITSGNIVISSGTTATTVGAAGGASALPATPLGYISISINGSIRKIPYYNA
jgi:hypothetical protein